MPDSAFWKNRKVLLTGHTGFKGAWLAIWLNRLGANVSAVSLPPETEPNLFNLSGVADLVDSLFADIRDLSALQKHIEKSSPEIVIHMAAQAIVRTSYREPVETYSTNVMGTVNLLQSLVGISSVKSVLVVTTDKVYQEQPKPHAYIESDPLGGHDPYSASKAACEIAIDSYRKSFLSEQGVAVASARAGNVIGGGDWSQDRLLPDALSSWGAGKTLEIRMPDAVRPWQHVLDPLHGYLVLAEKITESPSLAGAYNFGPDGEQGITVREVIEYARAAFGEAFVEYAAQEDAPREASWLALDTSKIANEIGEKSRISIKEAVEKTVTWQKQLSLGKNARNLCLDDIYAYESKL